MILEVVVIVQFILLVAVSIAFYVFWRNRQEPPVRNAPQDVAPSDNTVCRQHESLHQQDTSSGEAVGKEDVAPDECASELRKRKRNIHSADSDDLLCGEFRFTATDGCVSNDERKSEMAYSPASFHQNEDLLKDAYTAHRSAAVLNNVGDGTDRKEHLGGSERYEANQKLEIDVFHSEEDITCKVDDDVDVIADDVNVDTDLIQSSDKQIQDAIVVPQICPVGDATEAENTVHDFKDEKAEHLTEDLSALPKDVVSGVDSKTAYSVNDDTEGPEYQRATIKQTEDFNMSSENCSASGDSQTVHDVHYVQEQHATVTGGPPQGIPMELMHYIPSENQSGPISIAGMTFGENTLVLGPTDMGTQPKKRSVKQPKARSDKFTNMKRTASDQLREVNPDIYVQTRAYTMAEDLLLNVGVVVLIGSAGSGKTSIGLNLMKRIVDLQKRQPLVLTHHSQFEDIVTPRDPVNVKREEKLVVLLDDIYGKSNLVTEFQRSWEAKLDKVWPLIQSGFIKLIITIRTQIFLECKESLNAYTAFNKIHQIDLHGPDLCLTTDEKLNILKRHLQNAGIPMADEDRETAVKQTFTELGFPQCCKYFVSSSEAQKRGVEFFKRPVEYLKGHFVKLKSDRLEQSQYQYLVLLLTMFKQGVLTDESLDPFEDQTETISLIDKLKHVCRINSDVSLGQIKSSADSLCGLYLERNDETREYSFIHQSVFDTLFLQFSSEYLKQGITICPVTMLLQYIITPYVQKKGDVVVMVCQNNYSVLARRFTGLLKSSSARSILSHQSFKDEHFVEYLTNKFWKSVVPPEILSQKLDHHDHVTGVLFDELNLSNMWSDTEKQNGYFPDMKAHQSVNIQQKVIFTSSTAVSIAITEGLRTLSTWFVNGICPLENTVTENQREAFYASCFVGNADVIHILLNYGIVPNMMSFTAAAASNLDDISIFKTLLTHTDLVLRVHDLGFMLALALEKGNGKIARLLIDKISQMDSSHPTLEWALKHLLLQCHGGLRNSDLLKFHNHKLPTSVAIRAEDLFVKLSEYVTGINPGLRAFLAAAFDDLSILKNIVIADPTCLSTVSGTETLLHTASRYGCLDSVKFLLDRGLKITDANIKKQTALHLAAENNTSNVVECLLFKGADPNALDADENSPLHLASGANLLESAIKLVEMGSKLDTVNITGDSPLHIACKHNPLAFVKYLVEEESNINLENNKGMTPFHLALHYNKADVIQYLVRHGSDLKGPCPISYENFKSYPLPGCLDVAEFLFKKGVKEASDLFAVLLHRAVRVGNIMTVRFLLEKAVTETQGICKCCRQRTAYSIT
ncbi:uncharacterized protein LOC121387063 isoform X2 [Gigantopelta aegis]|uniref:uncharacterized protein LOC121387063 isoform X2 n=1 Tax=Gigantopelta aegis TaxID=1735272 RepID=UPI001B88E715|nr:uncharacterized protein LOC121387063 isoform X2 [Gigantopelta aegis]